ncbi:MAG: helix-turn-helix transcriptional regulator [Prevotellaceae bacterium]|jgi:transcriptional regulator with XRE-family HTH domain|nr:helix-turn-helix transcriptional regulator [Prevotellaceae bacterium]
MTDRLTQFLAAEQLSPARFADIIGVNRAGISHILAGRNKPGYDFLEKFIKHFPAVNIEWFITGRGKMYKEMIAQQLFPVPPEQPAETGNPLSGGLPEQHAGKTVAEELAPSEIIENNGKTVEQVIIFYTDKTFTAYGKRLE